MSAHTPAPWYVYRSYIPGTDGHEYSEQIREIATNNYVGAAKEADSAHIVLCVNAHDELVEALKVARQALYDHGTDKFIAPAVEIIDLALSKSGTSTEGGAR